MTVTENFPSVAKTPQSGPALPLPPSRDDGACLERAADPLHRAHAFGAARGVQGRTDSLSQLWYRRSAKPFPLATGPRQPSADSFLDHRPLELGEYAHHLKHRLVGRCRGVDPLLVQEQVDLERMQLGQQRGSRIPRGMRLTYPCRQTLRSSIQCIRFMVGASSLSPLHEQRAQIRVCAQNGDSVSRCSCPWRSQTLFRVMSNAPRQPSSASKRWRSWSRWPKEARAHAHRASAGLAQSAGGPPEGKKIF